MRTANTIEGNVTPETSQTSTGILGRMLDWIVNALEAYFGLAGQEIQADHSAKDFQLVNTSYCR